MAARGSAVRMRLGALAWRVVSLFITACSVACGPLEAKDYGRQLFEDPAFSGSQFNAWSCSTCHETTEVEANQRLSGHTLYDVAARPSWWGGESARLIDAASFCYVSFMRGPAALQPDEPRSRALYEYLKSISPSERAEAKPLTIVENITQLPRGDASAGARVYEQACAACHGAKGSGRGRNSERASILPEVTQSYAGLFPGVAPSLVVIEKVRHGQFFAVGGNMPPFALERLSDADLSALLSYLEL